jgi:HK97 family phage portal protein
MGGGIQSYVSSWAWTGKTISPDNAMEAPTVYACVRLISQTLARMPWQVLRQSADGSSNDPTHSVYSLLNGEANEDMTSFVFREAQISDCLLYGNSFAYISRSASGLPIALERLRPDLCYLQRDPQNQPYYQYWTGKADEKASEEIKQRKFRPYDILHVVGPSADGLLGEAPIHRMRDLIGMELELQEFTSRFFSQNCRPAGVLSMPGRLSAEGANRLREAFNRVHSGAQGAGKIAILEEGLRFEAISTNAKDSDLDSMKKFCRQQIAAAFNVPSHRVGDNDGVSYSSAEQANAVFVQSTLAGWAARLEQEVNRKLLKRGDDVTTRISFDDLLRGDMSTRFSAYAVAVTNGILTPNEIREREGLPAVEGGESIRLPLNTSTPTAAASAAPALQDPASTPQPSDVLTQPVDASTTLASEGLNGAQVAAILTILANFSTGLVTKDAAKALIVTAFPTLSQDAIATVLNGTNVVKAAPPTAPTVSAETKSLDRAVDLFYPTALSAMTRCCEAEAKYLKGCRTKEKVSKWIPDVARIASEIAPIMRGLLVLQGHSDRASDGIAIANAFAESIKTEARNADWHVTGHTETAVALATRLIQELIQTNKETL